MWNNLSHQSTRNEHTKRERCSPLLRLTSSLRQQNNALIEQLTIVSTVPIRHFYENKLFNGTLNYEVCSSLNRNFDTFKTSDTVQNYRNTFHVSIVLIYPLKEASEVMWFWNWQAMLFMKKEICSLFLSLWSFTLFL